MGDYIMKHKSISFFVYGVISLAIFFAPVGVYAKSKTEILGAVSYQRSMIAGTPIEVGIRLKGVKLESIFFGKNEALVILWNKTPESVKPNIGIALFDRRGKLVATGFDSRTFKMPLRAGKQGNYKLRFDKFISNYKAVASFKLVFSLTKTTSGGDE